MRVLVVEDEAIVAFDLQTTLHRLGHEVTAIAATGLEAIRSAEETSPDCVLMDIRLKGPMDGIEAARLLRERGNFPIVFLTAYTDRDTLRRAEAVGPCGIFTKPFDDGDIHRALESTRGARPDDIPSETPRRAR